MFEYTKDWIELISTQLRPFTRIPLSAPDSDFRQRGRMPQLVGLAHGDLEIHGVQRRSLTFSQSWSSRILDPGGSWRIVEVYVVLLVGKSLEGFCRWLRGLCLKLPACSLGVWGLSKESYRISIASWFMICCQMLPWCWLEYALGTLHVLYSTILKPKMYALDRQPKKPATELQFDDQIGNLRCSQVQGRTQFFRLQPIFIQAA